MQGRNGHLCAASTSAAGDATWIAALGKDIVLNGVTVDNFAAEKIRGVKALVNLQADTPLVVVPAQNVLEVNNKRPPTPFPEFVPAQIWEKSLWYQRLAFKLLYESKVEPSDKVGWFAQLPASFSTPLHWADAELEALQYPALQQKVAQQRREWREFFDTWQQQAASAAAGVISYAEFEWASECVNSRAFSGPYEGSSAQERSSLLIFTGALTLAWPLLNMGTYEQSISAAVVVGLSILARDVIFARSGQLKRYVMCPVVDMFNHQSSCQSDVSYNYFSNQFELRTGAHAAGAQVFISYGKQSNDRLLQFYGFAEQQNPYDSYDFGTGFLELMLRYADAITGQENPIPTSPPPQQRLRDIAAALQSTKVDESSYTGVKTRNSVQIGADIHTRYFRTAPKKVLAGEEEKQKQKDAVGQFEDVLLEAENRKSTGRDRLSSQPGNIVDKFDDVTVRAMRALYSSDTEWAQRMGAGPSLDSYGTPCSDSTERKVAAALRALAVAELEEKPTTLLQDKEQLGLARGQFASAPSASSFTPTSATKKGFGTTETSAGTSVEAVADPSGMFASRAASALAFRVEKKRLLHEAADSYVP